MTDKVLSQDEVDALLKGVASGDIDTEEAKEQIIAITRAIVVLEGCITCFTSAGG